MAIHCRARAADIVNWVRESLQEGEPIKVVSDQLRTPTYVGDLAKGLVEMINRKATGIYHLSGKEQLTPYQMALKTADHFSLDKSLITEVTADTFTQPAKRPPSTGFNITKAEKGTQLQTTYILKKASTRWERPALPENSLH